MSKARGFQQGMSFFFSTTVVGGWKPFASNVRHRRLSASGASSSVNLSKRLSPLLPPVAFTYDGWVYFPMGVNLGGVVEPAPILIARSVASIQVSKA